VKYELKKKMENSGWLVEKFKKKKVWKDMIDVFNEIIPNIIILIHKNIKNKIKKGCG
jgi:hypothetical protein